LNNSNYIPRKNRKKCLKMYRRNCSTPKTYYSTNSNNKQPLVRYRKRTLSKYWKNMVN
jgi:hypothetical protein